MTDLPFPLYAINMLRRILQLLAERDAVTLTIMRVGGHVYLFDGSSKPEKMG